MSSPHTFSILVNVTDAAALHAHAMARLTSGRGGMTTQEARAALGSPDKPNINECLRLALDPGMSLPGTEILDTTCSDGM